MPEYVRPDGGIEVGFEWGPEHLVHPIRILTSEQLDQLNELLSEFWRDEDAKKLAQR